MNGLGFREALTNRQKNTGSIICGGLDPNMENIPPEFLLSDNLSNLEAWMKSYVDVLADNGVSMFKPQLEHWERITGGSFVLKKIIEYIRDTYPDILIFGDANPGAIAGVDGMNFDFSIGERHCNKLLERYGKDIGMVAACRRNNRDSWKHSDISLGVRSETMWYESRAQQVLTWSEENDYINGGLLLGSAHPYDDFKELDMYAQNHPELGFYKTIGKEELYTGHISRVRKIIGNKLWLLVPGIGFSVDDRKYSSEIIQHTVQAGYTGHGSMVMNSSDGLSEAHLKPENKGKSYEQSVENEIQFMTSTAQGAIINLENK